MRSRSVRLACTAALATLSSACGSSGGSAAATTKPTVAVATTSAAAVTTAASGGAATNPEVAAAVARFDEVVAATKAASAFEQTVTLASCPFGDPAALVDGAPTPGADAARGRFKLSLHGEPRIECSFPASGDASFLVRVVSVPPAESETLLSQLLRSTPVAGPLGGGVYSKYDSDGNAVWLSGGFAIAAINLNLQHGPDAAAWLTAHVPGIVHALATVDPSTIVVAPQGS